MRWHCSGNLNCGSRVNLRHSYRHLRSRRHSRGQYVPSLEFAGFEKSFLTHPFRASSGKKRSRRKSLHPYLKAKSNVKRMELITGETYGLTRVSRIIRKVIAKEQQYIKDLDFIEEVRHGSHDAFEREAYAFLQGFHSPPEKRGPSRHQTRRRSIYR
jgi:hypothetical protein